MLKGNLSKKSIKRTSKYPGSMYWKGKEQMLGKAVSTGRVLPESTVGEYKVLQ